MVTDRFAYGWFRRGAGRIERRRRASGGAIVRERSVRNQPIRTGSAPCYWNREDDKDDPADEPEPDGNQPLRSVVQGDRRRGREEDGEREESLT